VFGGDNPLIEQEIGAIRHHGRKIKENSVKISISTDAQADAHLKWIKFGVATVRRGWIEPEDVINTLPLSKLLRFLSH
jgi:DNA polymerase (family 10)